MSTNKKMYNIILCKIVVFKIKNKSVYKIIDIFKMHHYKIGKFMREDHPQIAIDFNNNL